MANRGAVAGALLFLAAAAAGAPQQSEGGPRRAELRVGIDQGDLRGSDHRVLQAAVDQVAGLGGGVVRIGPGRYTMRNALILRSNVDLVGVPGETVLAACDAARSPLWCDGDCNERQITLVDPSGFQVGDGVAVRDERSGNGFAVTTATITARVDERTFRISAPLYLDYMVAQKASAAVSFPVVGGWGVKNVAIEGISIDGNRDRTALLDGCRGGGIYLFECEKVSIRNCAVRRYNGDGVSFQCSADVTVEDCLAEGNAGLGLHPGSGSQRPVMRRNRSIGNGQDGLYVCWRVKHGLFEKNEIRGNGRDGISIGHKDTDNLFRENTVAGNDRAGIFFREEAEPMGAHRNVFERNVILDNGKKEIGRRPRAAVVLLGHHEGVVFRGNTVGNSKEGGPAEVGFWTGKNLKGLLEEETRFQNLSRSVEREK